jgi:hypothetical protein
MKRRSTIVDLLLRENKILSITLYVVAVLSVLCGLVMLGLGVWGNQPTIALAGAIEMYLLIQAWRFVRELRRETGSSGCSKSASTGPGRLQQTTTHPESSFSFSPPGRLHGATPSIATPALIHTH